MIGVILALAAAAVLIGAAAVVALRRRWIAVTVRGGSMLPTLRHGDPVLARRRPPGRVRTGDIVVLEPPDPGSLRWIARPQMRRIQGRDWLIKRVAAVPGEPLPASVTPVAGVAARTSGLVPPGHVVVLGDNGGLDSRRFGLVPYDRLLAVVVRLPDRA